MHAVLRALGRAAFWLLWPFWFVYFRLVPHRSRVFVVAEGKLLVLSTWLGDKSWGLPGGGAKRGEDLALSACRELAEETGIKADAADLESLGSYIHTAHGFRFRAYFFLLRLDTLLELTRQKHEIADMRWVTKLEMNTLFLNQDARHGLTAYGDRF